MAHWRVLYWDEVLRHLVTEGTTPVDGVRVLIRLSESVVRIRPL